MTNPHSLTITTGDQHRFEATFYPTLNSGAPVLIFLSALGTPAKVYRHLGTAMAHQGVQLCAPDWRGIGSSSVRAGRGSDFGYQHLVEVDIPALVATLRQRYPAAPLWIGGHSLGGQLALLSAAANPSDLAGVILIASGSVHTSSYTRKLRWGVRFLTIVSGLVGAVVGYFPGSRLGFGGREAAGLMRDWSHVARTGEYRLRGSHVDYEQALGHLMLPVLAVTFAADTWAPAAATQLLLQKIAKRKPIHWHWDAAQTQGVALDHYAWIKRPDLVVPAVARYIHAAGAHA